MQIAVTLGAVHTHTHTHTHTHNIFREKRIFIDKK